MEFEGAGRGPKISVMVEIGFERSEPAGLLIEVVRDYRVEIIIGEPLQLCLVLYSEDQPPYSEVVIVAGDFAAVGEAGYKEGLFGLAGVTPRRR